MRQAASTGRLPSTVVSSEHAGQAQADAQGDDDSAAELLAGRRLLLLLQSRRALFFLALAAICHGRGARRRPLSYRVDLVYSNSLPPTRPAPLMSLIVQKYGGTSVADPERINAVADRVVETRRQGNQVVVVVSAMGHTTDQLIELAKGVTPDPSAREMDMLSHVRGADHHGIDGDGDPRSRDRGHQPDRAPRPGSSPTAATGQPGSRRSGAIGSSKGWMRARL